MQIIACALMSICLEHITSIHLSRPHVITHMINVMSYLYVADVVNVRRIALRHERDYEDSRK